jgi:VWFA-related protein
MVKHNTALLSALVLILTSQPAIPQQESATIRVSTRLVQISVTVHDKNGPVSGLKKSDFTILEQGKPRSVSLFSVTAAESQVQKAPPLPPNTFSNYIEHHASRPSTVTVILFDTLNTPAENQIYARQELLKFMKELQPQDRIALYTLTKKLNILLDFTADAGEITRTLDRFRGAQSFELEAAAKTGASEAGLLPASQGIGANAVVNGNLDIAAQMESDFYTESRVRMTAQALEAIANHVARLPGRKNLVWVSAAFPMALNMNLINPLLQRHDFNTELRRAVRAVNEANMAIYPVDARGLIGFSSFEGTQAGPTPSAALFPQRRPSEAASPTDHFPEGIEAMNELAGRTGGRAFYNSMDLKGAVRKALQDSDLTYTLGFYPEPNSLDNKFHDIKVEVNRKGLDVRYRKGYFAFNDESHSDQQRREELADALWSPLDATAIPLIMRLEHVDQPEPNLLRAYLAADIRSLTLEQKDSHWVGGVDVLMIQQDKTGKIIDSSLQTLNLDLDKTNYEAVLKTGMPLGKYLRPKQGLLNVRAIVLDRASGKVGSLIVPVSQVH